MSRYFKTLVLAVILPGFLACGSTQSAQSAPPPPPPSQPQGHQQIAERAPAYDDVLVESAAPSSRGSTSTYASRGATAQPQPAPPPDAELPEVDAEQARDQQLIYTGAIVLAIYDVEAIQREALSLVEELGGYVSERSSRQMTIRVPAAKFRDTLDELSALGDVLDKSWKAEDVTEEMRDLDIRLRNSLELRNRLEALLEEAESIQEALEIESELERITLEIERIRGTLQNMEDRIAYSTIELSFDAIESEDVPGDEFLLPFSWLYTLGLEALLRAPEVYR